jgi:hypothetical protein
MKRALVFSLVALFAFGLTSFGQLTGSWSTIVGIDPDAAELNVFFTSLDSTLTVDYVLSDWTFGSVSAFDKAGFASQEFSVGGALGAFVFASAMVFDPAAVTEMTYAGGVDPICSLQWTATGVGPRFISWDVTASVSIAGVAFEAYVLQDYSHYNYTELNKLYYIPSGTTLVQTTAQIVNVNTGANGMGWRLKVAGSFGAVDVTSYTYFNMTEGFASQASNLSIAKSGVFTVQDGCDGNFVEQYLTLEGFTFGCASVDIGLKITCTGFHSIAFLVQDIALGGFATFDFEITFTTSDKAIVTDINMVVPGFDCIVLEVGFNGDYAGKLNTTNVIDNITIHGIKFEQTWAGITFTSITELDAASKLMSGSTAYTYINDASTFLGYIPYVATLGDIDDGLWEAWCSPVERFKLWESFIIDVNADACCGGLFDLTITTDFGIHEELVWAGYATIQLGAVDYILVNDMLIGVFADGVDPDDASAVTTIDAVLPITVWAASGDTTLFEWARTNVVLGVGIGTNVELAFGFGISAFGWEALSAGFEWSF